LTRDGYQVTCKNSAVGLTGNDLKPYDLVLLDVMMPKMDGFSFCREIRREVDAPILFLTARTMDQDLVEGLSLGADDYIKKPFSLSELRARVSAHLRREHREHHQMLRAGNVRFDLSEKKLLIEEEPLALTKSEYEICELLVRNKGQVFTLEAILEQIFGFDSESDIGAIRVHVKNIRAKFPTNHCCPIETVWGMGYTWK
ncbi:MAG: response regulator transcription factor, partial [Lachnospiraceae bacterium]